MHSVTQYAMDVVHSSYGKMCGKWEILACQRHLDDLEKSKDEKFPYVFDETRADRIITFFSQLRRVDDPEKLIACEPWQVFDFGCVFGWVKKKTGKRRFKRAYMRIARGHAKTTMAAGTGLYFMTADAMYPPEQPEQAKFEHEPSINIVAVDRAQGKKAREDMASFAANTPEIKKRLKIKNSYIKHKTRGGEVVVFSKEKGNKDGGRPSLVITEEWHAHLTNAIHGVAVSSMGKKKQCLELIITTAGEDALNKPCYRDDMQYKSVLLGDLKQDDTFIMIREIDDTDDPHNVGCWCKSNAFFRTLSQYTRDESESVRDNEYASALYDEVYSQYTDAYAQNDYDKIREWLIKRMNRWQESSENKYFTGCMEKFRTLCVSREEFLKLTRGTKGFYGFDLGKTLDLSGVAYVTRLNDGRIAFSVHGFMPENRSIEHEHSDRVSYGDWAKDGYVTLTPGDVTDNRYVENWIYESEKQNGWKLLECDYDGHNATDLAIRIAEHYNKEESVVEIPQTCDGQNLATKKFRELTLNGELVVMYSPLLLWCLNNAIEIKDSNGNIKLSKKHKDDSQRIDPVAAALNALSRILVQTVSPDINEIIKKRGYAMT